MFSDGTKGSVVSNNIKSVSVAFCNVLCEVVSGPITL